MSGIASLVLALLIMPARAIYSVAFYHGDRNCTETSKAMVMYGGSVAGDYKKKCRYAETLKDDGSRLFHLAWSLTCTSRKQVVFVDYVPSIGSEGCEEATPFDPKTDAAYAFSLTFVSGQCIEADSPDGDPSGESWKVTFDEAACGGGLLV